MTSVRLRAARALMAIEQGHSTLAAALDRERDHAGDVRDRALLVELVAGTLRWRNELDALVAAAASRDLSTIDLPVVTVLRLGAYQMRHLTRIPPHAIVHESVETVRALGAPRAAGFVNAVLRALSRGRGMEALPARPATDSPVGTQIDYLAVTWSHPRWLVGRWIARFGFEATETWCRFNNTPPEVTLRPIAPATTAEMLDALAALDLGAALARYEADAIVLPAGALGRIPPSLAARVAVQDEGSQLVARFAGVTPGETVVDLCAAPGGKTAILAAHLSVERPASGSRLFACDYRLPRVRLLRRRLAAWRLPVPVVAVDARGPLPFGAIFDCVVIDAPCSGLGTLRRDPDLKWSRQAEDLARFAADQDRMLAAAADLVTPGGRLLYATCSSEPEENEARVEAFLNRTGQAFAADTPPAGFPAALVDRQGYLRTTPVHHGLDAYFAARLVRKTAA